LASSKFSVYAHISIFATPRVVKPPTGGVTDYTESEPLLNARVAHGKHRVR